MFFRMVGIETDRHLDFPFCRTRPIAHIGNVNAAVSRHAWIFHHGPVPEGLVVRHKAGVCHDVEARCFNVRHLELGTQSENMLDKAIDGTGRMGTKTHCPEGHELTPDNTYNVPPTVRRPKGFRQCRICKTAAKARFETRKRQALKESKPATAEGN